MMYNNNILNETFQKHLQIVNERLGSRHMIRDPKTGALMPAVPPPVKVNPKQNEPIDNTPVEPTSFWDDFQTMTVSSFVNKYKNKLSDPKFKTFISSGVRDMISDEKFVVSKTTKSPKDLTPSQNEIGFGNSLDDLIKDSGYGLTKQLNELRKILEGNPLMLSDPSGEQPIVIFAGKYIIDGHHRWSKAACANPNAKLICLDFYNESIGADDVEKALKAFHLAIGVDAGIKTSQKSGKNLINSSESEVKDYVTNNLEDQFLTRYKTFGSQKNNVKSKEDVGGYIASNAAKTIIGVTPATDTPRGDMPQTGTSATYVDRLTKGDINFNKDAVTMAGFSEGKQLNETFEKHIRLLKEFLKNR